MDKKHRYLFISFLLFNLLLRYPESHLQTGSDSFTNNLLSQSIINNGFDLRFVNTLSFFGLFPGTNVMGSAFVLSTFSIVSDVSVHDSIFILPIMYSVIASLSVFLLTQRITSNTSISLISILLFSTSRRYLSFTDFTYTYRSLFVSLSPLLLLFIIILTEDIKKRRFNIKVVSIVSILLISLASIHRLIYLTGLLIAASVIYLLIDYFLGRRLVNKTNDPKIIASITSIVILLYIASIYGYSIYSGSSDYSLALGKRFIDSDFVLFTVINLGLLYSMAFGLTLPLTVLGYFVLFSNRKHGALLLLIIILYSLIWTDITYGFLAYLPIIVILICLGVQRVFNSKIFYKRKATVFSCFIILLLFVQILPNFVTVKETEYDYFKTGEYDRDLEYIKGYDAGIYLKSSNLNHLIVSNILSDTRVAAYSETPIAESSLYDNAEYYDYKQNPLADFLTGNLNHIYEIEDDNLERTYRYEILLSNERWDSYKTSTNIEYIFRGDGKYILLVPSKDSSSVQNDFGEWQISNFVLTGINDNYKFYDNGMHNFYCLDYNN